MEPNAPVLSAWSTDVSDTEDLLREILEEIREQTRIMLKLEREVDREIQTDLFEASND